MAGELLGVDGPNLSTLTAPLPGEDSDDETRPQLWEQGALLPVRVVLRDLASQLPLPGSPVNAETVWRFIQGELRQAALDDFAPLLKEEMLKHGALVLLDGLDEVPDAHRRREQIKQALQDFAITFSRCRFLVTSRTYAYQNQDWMLDDFDQVQLMPFTTGQIRRFVDAWYRHMVELMRLSETSARDRAELLQRTVERNARIRELAERPLLLTDRAVTDRGWRHVAGETRRTLRQGGRDAAEQMGEHESPRTRRRHPGDRTQPCRVAECRAR